MAVYKVWLATLFVAIAAYNLLLRRGSYSWLTDWPTWGGEDMQKAQAGTEQVGNDCRQANDADLVETNKW